MSDNNPIRQILQNLVQEFQAINTICLHFNVHINALIEERTRVENKRLIRRCCRCLRFVDVLKPETSTFYKDKSKYILGMLQDVGVQYDDLKQRYFWALDRLAEVTMKVERLKKDQLEKEAREKRLEKSWKDVGKQRKDQNDSSGKSKGIEDIDKLIGLMLFEDGNKGGQGKTSSITSTSKKQECSKARLYTKITKSSRLTKIEDIPLTDSCESEDPFKRKNGISRMLKKLRKPRKSSGAHKAEELANKSEIKMQMFALMAEIVERDEIIDFLKSQMKIKDSQLAQLAEIIRREKLGFAINTSARRQSESETTEKEIL